jgi:hypothetical protein
MHSHDPVADDGLCLARVGLVDAQKLKARYLEEVRS